MSVSGAEPSTRRPASRHEPKVDHRCLSDQGPRPAGLWAMMDAARAGPGAGPGQWRECRRVTRTTRGGGKHGFPERSHGARSSTRRRYPGPRRRRGSSSAERGPDRGRGGPVAGVAQPHRRPSRHRPLGRCRAVGCDPHEGGLVRGGDDRIPGPHRGAQPGRQRDREPAPESGALGRGTGEGRAAPRGHLPGLDARLPARREGSRRRPGHPHQPWTAAAIRRLARAGAGRAVRVPSARGRGCFHRKDQHPAARPGLTDLQRCLRHDHQRLRPDQDGRRQQWRGGRRGGPAYAAGRRRQ